VLASLGVALDRRLSQDRSTQRRLGRLGAGLAILAVLAALAVALLATHGHPVARVERAWSSFANVNNTANGSSRFTTLGSQRVDFWRVALHEFTRHPFTGIGQDNFAASYLRYRKTGQEPRWTHSIELRLLTHTGLVGICLFGLFLIAVLLASRTGREHAPERIAAAIALIPLVVWLVHGSIDWLWEFPALSVPALAFAGAAAALEQSASPAPSHSSSPSAYAATGGKIASKQARRPGRLAIRWICAALLWACMLVAIGVPFVAARKVQRAIDLWPARANLAYAELRSASKLMPFDYQPYLVGGAIALNLQEPAAARLWFVQARRHDGEAWLAPFALGLIDGEQGRFAQARRELAAAQTLNPGEPILAQALARLGGGHPLTFVEVQRLLSTRAEQRFGH
ncbi:MAG TPA: O-antigen ligase family protein, partial [Solirubrobacteraceae bacterium]|nr:O-antigen ligase family protein [Solirubrobacteraceae bacterium]